MRRKAYPVLVLARVGLLAALLLSALVPAGAAPQIPELPRVSFRGLSLPSAMFGREEKISAALIAAIDRAEKSALVSLYDLKMAELGDALVRAHRRGVAVRVVYDRGHAEPKPGPEGGGSPEYAALLAAGVPVRLLKGGGSFGIMHNKFAVLDGAFVATGSFNWTRAADERHFENESFRDDPATVAGFTRAFEWSWGLARAPGEPAGAVEPGEPPADADRPVEFAGGRWPRWAFSPRGGIEDMLVEAIGRARFTVDAAIFSFYSQRVADALAAARARGVLVRVAADAGQARRSKALASLKGTGVELRLSGGRAPFGVMHHKYLIADGEWLMTGSYNFSINAEQYNFENVLFTTVPGELAAYGAEFQAVWDQARPAGDADLAPPNTI